MRLQLLIPGTVEGSISPYRWLAGCYSAVGTAVPADGKGLALADVPLNERQDSATF